MQVFIRAIYSVIIGVFLVFLVGYGIAVFYPAPTEQVDPCTTIANPQKLPVDNYPCQIYTLHQITIQNQYQTTLNQHDTITAYSSLGFAVLYCIVGIVLFYIIQAFSPGFFLGSLFTLFYSLNRAGTATNSQVEFLIACVGFILVMSVGYLLFIREKIFTSK